jgi:nucleoside-triphosphatase
MRLSGPPRVARYGVDLEAFERLALPELLGADDAEVIVIDELGKMELASEAFRNAVSAAFESETPIVATVHVARHPFTDALKNDGSVEILGVSRRSRDELPEQLVERLLRARRGQTP